MKAGHPGREGRSHTSEQLRTRRWGWRGGEVMGANGWKGRNGALRFSGMGIRRMGWDGPKEWSKFG